MMLGTPFQTTRLNAALAALALAMVAALAGFGAGFALGQGQAKARGDAALQKLKGEHASEQKNAAAAALERLRSAQQRGDQLAQRLAAAETDRKTQAEEHALEIQRLTTGRPCLNAGTVRLLNQPADTLNAARVPAPAGRTAAEDAPAASDTDVAGWISGAQRQYGECRGRLDALIDWHAEAEDAGH